MEIILDISFRSFVVAVAVSAKIFTLGGKRLLTSRIFKNNGRNDSPLKK